jgi:hypothetical protein
LQYWHILPYYELENEMQIIAIGKCQHCSKYKKCKLATKNAKYCIDGNEVNKPKIKALHFVS